MSPPIPRYKIPRRVSDRSVVEALRGRWQVRVLDAGKSRRTYIDTADSRLLKDGWALAVHSGESGTEKLEVSSAADDSVIASSPLADVPQWGADLPEGEPWRQLASAIGERRLLTRMKVESSTKLYAILDDEAKTTVRVHVERHMRTDGQAQVHRLRLLTVAPVRGYEKQGRAVSKLLSDAGLPSQQGSITMHLASPAGIAGTPGARRPGPMNRSMPIALAVGGVLSSLRQEMIANESGVRERIDIEFLHDYRIAARRARSVLNQVRAVLPKEMADALSGELRWLGTLTGPARDLDVQLGDTREGALDLEGMRRLLEKKRSEAQDALVAAIDSPRYKSLLDTWEQLEETMTGSAGSGVGAQPAGPAIDHYIDRAHRRVVRIGRTIDDASEPELLHDLRKKTKALRYLLEMFASLYSTSELKMAVRELKALQDNLGEFQDSQVQAAAIRHLAEEMLEGGTGTASELMAMGRVADALERGQMRARVEFAERFARFSSPEVSRRYRRMFGPAREPR
jgi:CHAD domain-containing protein